MTDVTDGVPAADDAWLHEVYAIHWRRLVRLATLMLDGTGEAEEVVQDAIVALYARRDRFGDAASAGGYLRTAVVNRCRSLHRHRAVVNRTQGPDLPTPEEPDAAAVRHDEGAHVLAALRGLPQRQREVLILRYFAEASEAEIADALGISRGTVKSHAHRGLGALRGVLADAGAGVGADVARVEGHGKMGRMPHFDLCVIGSGSGNAILDDRFRDWRVALVDDGDRFGGTCLNYGCIPTKMFVHPADVARVPDEAGRLGVRLDAASVDWAAVRDRVFARIDPISTGGEAWRARQEHVTLFRETGRFVGARAFRVGGVTLTADRFVVAAGSRCRDAGIPGTPEVADRVHTSQDVMRLDALPASLLVVGGGYVAAEFAHVFAAYGTRVTLAVRGAAVLRKEDEEISRRFTARIASYTDLRLSTRVVRLARTASGVAATLADDSGLEETIEVERVLLAVGRVPNADTLDVAAAGIATDERGFVVVDDQQRTTAEGVWALGDVCSPWMLKHVANHEARVVQHNLLHPEAPVTADHRFVPHAVFSYPFVAAVGLTEAAARAAGIDVTTKVQEYADVAYGWALEDEGHCVKLVADRATGQLVGAHILGPEAPDLLQPLIQAMSFGLGAHAMARGQYWIHPALSEVVENALLGLDVPTLP